jgi:hypothetical protein
MIARKYHRKRHDVSRWLARTKDDQSEEAVLSQERSGRKRKTTVTQDAKIETKYRKVWREKGYGRRTIDKELRNKPSSGVPPVSGKTVYRRCEEKAGKMKVVPKKFLLTERHKKARRKWAKEVKGEDFEQWLFSDETLFKVGQKNRKAFQFDGEKLEDIKHKQPVRQSVWACMSSSGVGQMEFVDGPLTGEKYKQILNKKLIKATDKLFHGGDWKFQQDNDPKHKSRVAMAWLEEKNIDLVPWPACSPDMNVQENLHRTWKDRVDNLKPTTKKDLRKKISKVFREMTEDDTRPLVDSMVRRVKALSKAKGGHTKY